MQPGRSAPSLEHYTPLRTAEKFKIATQDSFDPGTVILSAAFAGIAQLTNSLFLAKGLRWIQPRGPQRREVTRRSGRRRQHGNAAYKRKRLQPDHPVQHAGHDLYEGESSRDPNGQPDS